MANKKVKRWRSRPAGKKGNTYASYPRPAESEVYHLKPEGEKKAKKETSELEQRYREEKAQQNKAAAAPAKKKKKKYKSVQASSQAAKQARRGYTSYSEKEQERIERAKRRNRNSVMLRALIASAVFIIGIVLSIFIFFKVGEIKVTGSKKYTAAQVVEASGVELGDNLFAPTALSVQSKLDKQLPYIKSVTLKHELPDVLVICVKESTAQFAFKSSNKNTTKYILTDADLKLLEVADKPAKGAAIIEGVGIVGADMGEKAKFKEPEKGDLVKTIKAVFADNGMEDVTSINVKSTVDIEVVYNNAITVQIGQANALDYKCKIAAKAIEDALKENEKAKGTVNVKQADQTRQAYFNPNS
ncbi:MAG: FtsQ-type POTRA domain-containing protein [Clostridia bacterium]|nr:FtsQ-type POTRA domain-containing protein [Clostridia bacterium]